MKHSGDFSIGSSVWPGTSKLIEEMGELQQVLGKLLGSSGEVAHWDGTDLGDRLVEEIADLKAAIEFFQRHNLSEQDAAAIEARTRIKLALFEAWHHGDRK